MEQVLETQIFTQFLVGRHTSGAAEDDFEKRRLQTKASIGIISSSGGGGTLRPGPAPPVPHRTARASTNTSSSTITTTTAKTADEEFPSLISFLDDEAIVEQPSRDKLLVAEGAKVGMLIDFGSSAIHPEPSLNSHHNGSVGAVPFNLLIDPAPRTSFDQKGSAGAVPFDLLIDPAPNTSVDQKGSAGAVPFDLLIDPEPSTSFGRAVPVSNFLINFSDSPSTNGNKESAAKSSTSGLLLNFDGLT